MTEKQERRAAVAIRDPYAILDRLDENAFVAEMAGQIVRTYVYEVETWDPQTRQRVKAHQLSKSGVDAVCRELANRNEVIREDTLDVFRDDVKREATFHVKATRYRIRETADGRVQEIPLDSTIGVKRQPYNIIGKAGSISDRLNPHWYEHGAMKAARNARRRLIPEAIAVELIKLWAGEKGRVRTVTERDYEEDPGADYGPPPPEPPPAPARERVVDSEKLRSAATARVHDIESLLAQTFGDGPPWEHEQKIEVLNETFGTRHWKSIRERATKEPGRFLREAQSFDENLAAVASS